MRCFLAGARAVDNSLPALPLVVRCFALTGDQGAALDRSASLSASMLDAFQDEG